MKTKKIAALLLCGTMLASVLTGCSSVKKDAVVATLDGKDITLGIANFAARFTQASYDDFYVAYFGEDVWSSDLYSSGSTTQDSLKENIIKTVEDLYVIQNHMDDYGISLTDDETAAIKEAAETFMSDNTKAALDQLGATEEIVEEYLTLNTIQNKMYDAIIVDADTNVSDEDANMRGYSYVQISTTSYTGEDGKSVEYTEDEKALLATTVDNLAKSCQDDFEGAITDAGYTVSTGTYAKDDDKLDAAVVEALDGLKEGEVSGLVTTDSAYYILRVDTDCDKEATETHRQDIIKQRQSDLYNQVLSGWEEDAKWELKEDVWATVQFDNLFTTTVESTETEEPSEAASESVDTSAEGTETVDMGAQDTESVNDTESVQ